MWRADHPPRPPLRGDELIAELGIEPAPRSGALLELVEEAAFAGEAARATRRSRCALAKSSAR